MPPVLDVARLAELGVDLGDDEFLKETVDIYLAELPGRQTTMRAAFDSGDRERLRAGAHSLGSASALMGASELASACRAIELRARDATSAELASMFHHWSVACDRTGLAIREWFDLR